MIFYIWIFIDILINFFIYYLYRNTQKISTQELQKAHFSLGNYEDNYSTTYQRKFDQKEIVIKTYLLSKHFIIFSYHIYNIIILNFI